MKYEHLLIRVVIKKEFERRCHKLEIQASKCQLLWSMDYVSQSYFHHLSYFKVMYAIAWTVVSKIIEQNTCKFLNCQ